jgi:hypothetical protein
MLFYLQELKFTVECGHVSELVIRNIYKSIVSHSI